MEKNQVVEKIQKLLALANSSNEHEAKLAAQKATELLTKHNLSLQDIAVSERDYCAVHFAGNKSRKAVEQKYIFGILMTFFFIRVVSGKKFDYSTCKFFTTWSFLGQRHNVEIATYVHKFLDNTFHNLYTQYKKTLTTKVPNAKNSFYYGLYIGIRDQLEASKEKAQRETGLVLVKDAGLEDFINDTFNNNLKKGKSMTIASIDAKAFAQGVKEGQNVRIAKGLEGSGNDGKQMGVGPMRLGEGK